MRRSTASTLAAWLPPLLLTGYFVGIAVATATSSYAGRDLAMLAGCYALLASALHVASLSVTALWRALGLLAGLGLGAVLVWHLREHSPVRVFGAPTFAIASALFALAWLPVLRKGCEGLRPGRLAATAGALAAGFVLLLTGLFHGSNTFRWHLLRHNKLLGTASYYAFAEPVDKLSRARWERSSGAANPVAPAPLGLAEASAGPRSNILLIVVDTLRADSLAAWGGPARLMPQTNRLVESSVVFANMISNAAWTRPSVASLFTGLLPEEHGAVDREYGLPEARVTLAETLNGVGYETAAFVVNFAAVGRDAGFDQGFEHFEEIPGGGNAYARAEQVNQAVHAWLALRSGSGSPDVRPVFLYVHYLDPHPPYLAAGGLEAAQQALGATASYWEVQRTAYEAQLGYLDGWIPPLIEAVRAALPGPTALLLTSDHGEEFGEHGEGGHGHSLYREVLAVPALLNCDGIEPERVDAPLSVRDLHVVLLRLALPGSCSARLWAGLRERTRRYASVDTGKPYPVHRPYLERVFMRGVEEDGYFLMWSGYGSTVELYEEGDTGQRWNLEREQPGRVEAMTRTLEQAVGTWVERVPAGHGGETQELLRALGYVQ